MQPVRGHCGAPAVTALQRAWVELGGGNGDAPMAAFQQVLRQRDGGLDLRQADGMHAGHIAQLHQQVDTGHATACDQCAGGIAAVQAGDQQARRAVLRMRPANPS